MGHEVYSGPLPPTNKVTAAQVAALKKACPTQEQLEACDLILICGAEYLQDWIRFLYPQWDKIKTVKAGWFHESLDYAAKKNVKYDDVLKYIDVPFLPNPQDAIDKKTKWLPIGVDTEMFKPAAIPLKPIEVGFTGLLYEKRAKFLGTLIPYVGDLEIRFGNIQLLGADSDTHLFKRQTEILAQNYCAMEILLNLPSMSNVLVMKVIEAMACGTFVLTPEMPSLLHEKLGFKDGKDLVFYQESKPKEVSDMLHYFLNHDDEREQIVKQGCKFVKENFRMEKRVEEIING